MSARNNGRPRDDFSIPPAAPDANDVDDGERHWALAQRRRMLARWVVLAVGASIALCLAAVVRVVAARTAAASDAEVVIALPAHPPSAMMSAPSASPPPSAAPAPIDSSPAPKSSGAGGERAAPLSTTKCPKRMHRGARGDCVR